MDFYFDKLCFEDQKKNEENEIIIKEEEFKKAFNQTFDYKKINDKISFEDNLDYNNKPTSMETPSTINEETSIKIKPGRKKKEIHQIFMINQKKVIYVQR